MKKLILTFVVACLMVAVAQPAQAQFSYVDAEYGGPLAIKLDGNPADDQTFCVGDTISITGNIEAYATICHWPSVAHTEWLLQVDGPSGPDSDSGWEHDYSGGIDCAEVWSVETPTISYTLTTPGTHTVYIGSVARVACAEWGHLDFASDLLTFEVVYRAATIEKELLEGPPEIGIYLPEPTLYMFEITYINYCGSAARIIDTVPAEFEIIDLFASDGEATFFDTSRGKGNSANRIVWDAPDGSSTLKVWIQTVASPGKGHKEGIVFKPTSCGPLPINDGATAYEVDENGDLVLVEVVDPVTGEVTFEPVVIVGPSNALVVEAVAGAKPCGEEEDVD